MKQGQTLWTIAAEYFGDPLRDPVIFEANQGRVFGDGRTLTDPNLIIPAPAEVETEPAPPVGEDESAPPAEDGEIIDPGHDEAPESPEPSDSTPETETPESDPSADEASETVAETDTPETAPGAISSIPVGVWLGTGTFLAATTATLITRRIRKRRTMSPPSPARGEEQPVSGRLSDLETLIDQEQQRLTTPQADPGPSPKPAVPQAPAAADRETTFDLFDLAATGLGLIGPGQRGEARAAIIAALEADVPVTITAETADQLSLDPVRIPAASGLTVAADIFDAFAAPGQADEATLIVVTAGDLDGIGANAFAEQLAEADLAAVILADWPTGPTFALAADGTVEHATDTEAAADIEQFYIADTQTLHTVLDTYTDGTESDQNAELPEGETDSSVDPDQSETDDDPDEESGDVPADSATAPAIGTAAEAPDATRLRLCVFGEVDLYAGGVPVPLKQRARAQTLLAVLACSSEPRTMTELMDLVVADRPLKNARRYTNIIITNIRHAVRGALRDETADPVPFDKKTETLRLDTDLIETDLAEFDDAEQTAALATDAAERAAALERLVALHVGDLAPDVEALDDLRANYRAAAERACRTLADYYSENGDPARAAKYRTLAG